MRRNSCNNFFLIAHLQFIAFLASCYYHGEGKQEFKRNFFFFMYTCCTCFKPEDWFSSYIRIVKTEMSKDHFFIVKSALCQKQKKSVIFFSSLKILLLWKAVYQLLLNLWIVWIIFLKLSLALLNVCRHRSILAEGIKNWLKLYADLYLYYSWSMWWVIVVSDFICKCLWDKNEKMML